MGGRRTSEPRAVRCDALIDMLELLWKNQERHARSDGRIVDVAGPEAEIAVSLAVTLVTWFNAGLVQRA